MTSISHLTDVNDLTDNVATTKNYKKEFVVNKAAVTPSFNEDHNFAFKSSRKLPFLDEEPRN
jgi:hypothetical protein